MGSVAKVFKKVSKSIKRPISKITKGIARGIAKVGKSVMRGVGKLGKKLGPIGMIGLAIAMPYALWNEWYYRRSLVLQVELLDGSVLIMYF